MPTTALNAFVRYFEYNKQMVPNGFVFSRFSFELLLYQVNNNNNKMISID